jgi:hypothetical protein
LISEILHDGLWPIRATNGGAGTALDTLLFGNYLLRQGQPRSVDLLPIFYTGVPNLAPYQLATGKNGNPLAVGKPFINNFLPTFGDMLRLNMAVPVTPRNSPAFSSLGLVQAAVLGLTDPAPYNSNTNYTMDTQYGWISKRTKIRRRCYPYRTASRRRCGISRNWALVR